MSGFGLTLRQMRVLATVEQLIAAHGVAPSIEEIDAVVGGGQRLGASGARAPARARLHRLAAEVLALHQNPAGHGAARGAAGDAGSEQAQILAAYVLAIVAPEPRSEMMLQEAAAAQPGAMQ